MRRDTISEQEHEVLRRVVLEEVGTACGDINGYFPLPCKGCTCEYRIDLPVTLIRRIVELEQRLKAIHP